MICGINSLRKSITDTLQVLGFPVVLRIEALLQYNSTLIIIIHILLSLNHKEVLVMLLRSQWLWVVGHHSLLAVTLWI